jgi:hypothetical protein
MAHSRSFKQFKQVVVALDIGGVLIDPATKTWMVDALEVLTQWNNQQEEKKPCRYRIVANGSTDDLELSRILSNQFEKKDVYLSTEKWRICRDQHVDIFVDDDFAELEKVHREFAARNIPPPKLFLFGGRKKEPFLKCVDDWSDLMQCVK